MKIRKLAARLAKLDWLLIAIVALGLALRLWNIDWGLPFVYHPDEPLSINGAIRMLKTGDLNPHNFHWGSILHYLNAVLYLGYFLIGKLMGTFSTPADIPYVDLETIAVGQAPIPAMFLLSRVLVALAGTGSVVVTFAVGRQVAGRAVGLLAAILLAISPTSVSLSHIVKTDTLLVFFSLVSIWASLRIVTEPRLANYIVAGIAAGLAVSSKYNAALILIPMLTAHLLHFGKSAFLRKEIVIGLLCVAVGFLVATPYAVLDFATFRSDLMFDAVHYASGHAGAEGNSLSWYREFLWGQNGILLIFSVCGVLSFLIARSKIGVVLSIFPIVYLGFISSFAVHFESTALPLAPFILLLASAFLVTTFQFFSSRVTWNRSILALGGSIGFAILAVPSLLTSATNDLNLARTDAREAARVWIDRNLPRGSRIALEPYAPYVDRARFTVEGFEDITKNSPEWYERNGFEYLVFSYGAYGRFFENPALYPEFVGLYNEFFSRLEPVVRFDEGGYEVRIYKTKPGALPNQRIAARFGIYAPWIELAGYDWHSPNLTLYWRVLEERRETFRLTTRLLDSEGNAIVESSASPFGGSGLKPQGIVQVPWTVVVPLEARPGVYRLELDLNADGQGRVPLLSYDNQPVSDKVSIGPLKFPSSERSAAEWQNAQSIGAKFGQAISLQRFSITSSNIHPGDLLSMLLYWQSAPRVEKDYTVFIHLLDANGNVRAQIDAMPGEGRYPTSVWDVDEIVRDNYALRLPNDLAPGNYKIQVGLYEQPSLSRLPVVGADGTELGDHLILGEVTIR